MNVLKMSVVMLMISHAVSAQFSLPPLEYSYNALEPYIDAMTMEIHYTKHHQGYVNNLNKAVEGTRLAEMPLDEMLINAEARGTAIRNNGGGHYNHSLFWSILSPEPDKTPNGNLATAIQATFGSLDSLKKALNIAATKRFGSGWAWLYVTPDKKLAVSSSPNQDNPLMDAAGSERGIPILGIDVWEHAYYLKYQNKRGDYLGAIWNVLDWERVSENYDKAMSSPLLLKIEKDSWTALKDFHKVMAQTYHPMEEGNFTPIRTRSGELVEKAELLASSPIPSSFNTTAIKTAINDLIMGSKKLHKLALKKGNDSKVKDSLDALHDVFHTIQGLCSH
ncbi:MAG: superoxide dismutase [Lewinellaceae bacterium]|nr:superoxide dismutase [Lewinellaceae bacterium]